MKNNFVDYMLRDFNNTIIRKKKALYDIRPSKKRSNKRRADEDEDEDIGKTKYDNDDTDQVRAKNKYTKYDVELYENKSDEKTDNEKVDPETINCPICYDNVKISYITTCNHNFCYNCVDTLMTRSKTQHWVCPICRKICNK